MIKNIKSFAVSCCVLSFSVANGAEVDLGQKFLYFGGEIGVEEPVVGKFRHKSGSTFTLKRSQMYSGTVGYEFYPGMSIEFSGTHHPKYRLGYVLPQKNLANGMSIPKTPGTTKVLANVYLVNLVYNLQEFKGLTPFVTMGAGIAQVRVKPSIQKWQAMNIDFFRINKSKTNCFTWQIGLGVSKNLTSNLSIDMTARFQVVQGLKIKYDTLDLAKRAFVPSEPIKKTIGLGEIGVGFTYKIPLK